MYATIAAILRNNCYIDTTDFRVYPNVYVIIVSKRSSITRKSIPMEKVLDYLNIVGNTKILQGRGSMEGYFDALKIDNTTVDGKMLKGAQGILYSEELTTLIRQDISALEILTDWYTYRKVYQNRFRGSGFKELYNLCITLLGTTNDVLIKDLFTRKEQEGGLLARSMIVREEKRKLIRSPLKSYDKPYSDNEFIGYLKEVARRIHGKFTLTKGAKDLYDKWVESITDDKVSASGLEARIPIHVLKLSITKSVAKDFNQEIDKSIIESAIEECIGLIKNYRALTMGAGESPLAKSGAHVLAELYRSYPKTLSKKEILQRILGDVSLEILDKVIDEYRTADFIDTILNGELRYKLSERGYKLFASKLSNLNEEK